MAPNPIIPQQQIERGEDTRLKILVVGAGLGGLAAAIACRYAGHSVTVLEGAKEIGEIGAGLQTLPNSSRVLMSWGLGPALSKVATEPRLCNMWGYKGDLVSHWDIHAARDEYGAPYWDFHRASLHRCLYDKATELGAEVMVDSRVNDVLIADDQTMASVIADDGRRMMADLVIGADGVRSRCRDILLGYNDPPKKTGDLAYRVLLDTEEILKHPELKDFILDPQVNYWMGPDIHIVSYVLRGGKQFNMVLLVPDDLPEDTIVADGDVTQMREMFKEWDPRVQRLLGFCKAVTKWRLCIRNPGDNKSSWSHSSGAFTLMGDAVHATLPYLASGSGMAIEDASVLGLCLSRITSKSPAEKAKALRVYELCRRQRTQAVVETGNLSQWHYHLRDGPDQIERDERMRAFGEVEKGPGSNLPDGLKPGDDPLSWRRNGVGRWLLDYDCTKEVDLHWPIDMPTSHL